MTTDIPPRAALWDMDGTLLDSAEYHWLAWRDSMLDLGYPLTYEEFVATFGQRNDTILRSWISKEITDIEITRISDVKETRYRTLVRELGIELLPGVRGWLERLQAAGWRQAVASSAPRANVETLVEILGIGAFFGALVAAEDVQRGKPDPQVFLTAAERLAVPPARCVVLEDAPAGIEAAHRAGMRAIGIRSSHPGLQANITVDTLDELPEDTFEHLVSP
jgi:beta-phosphoglucomutase family hydrolase